MLADPSADIVFAYTYMIPGIVVHAVSPRLGREGEEVAPWRT